MEVCPLSVVVSSTGLCGTMALAGGRRGRHGDGTRAEREGQEDMAECPHHLWSHPYLPLCEDTWRQPAWHQYVQGFRQAGENRYPRTAAATAEGGGGGGKKKKKKKKAGESPRMAR